MLTSSPLHSHTIACIAGVNREGVARGARTLEKKWGSASSPFLLRHSRSSSPLTPTTQANTNTRMTPLQK